MKRFFKYIVSLVCGTMIFSITIAQPNPSANPYSQSINAATSPIRLGETVVSTFELGNNGSDPIPAGGAWWNISFPKWVTPDRSSLNLDGGSAIFQPVWNVVSGVTYLRLNVIGAGIPAKVLFGPQTKFTMTINLVGTTVGGPNQQTINDAYDAAISQNLNAGDDNANGPIEVIPSVVVPVKLATFNASKAGTASLLKWTTSQESNSSVIIIERSADGNNYAKIGEVPAAGYSASARNYSFTDASPLNGENYYRLKMVDKDGKFEYSVVRTVNFSAASDTYVSVYPNPFTEKVMVKLNVTNAGTAMIMVYDNSGKIVRSQAAPVAKGDNILTVKGLEKLAVGTYIIRINDGSRIITERIVK